VHPTSPPPEMTRRRCTVLLLGLALAAALLASSAAGQPVTPRLTIYAAASLTQVFVRFDPKETYSFGGSNTLAAQIQNGAPADVFAAASTTYTQALYSKGLVEKPVAFASNRLVLIVPSSNPAGIRTVYDLARRGVRIVVAGPAVPVGAYTRVVLSKLGLTSVLANVVSQEPDVKGVVGKVALGQADAGFVYVTDARAAARQVRQIRIPSRAQPRVRYEIAVVRGSRQLVAARTWIHGLLDKEGRRVLAAAGFGPP
jgi:molybdate transport system substrate-binding protein